MYRRTPCRIATPDRRRASQTHATTSRDAQLPTVLAVAVSVLGVHTARADVAFSNPYPTATGVGGVAVAVYHRGTDQSLATIPAYADLYDTAAYVRGHTPSYSFVDTAAAASGSIAWGTVPDATTTAAFFGGQAAGAAATDSAPVDSTAFDVTGLVYLPAAGTYTFDLSTADDGALLYFGGTGLRGSAANLIAARTYSLSIDSAPGQTDPAQVTLATVNGHSPAGWYPFECIYYNQYNPLHLGAAGLSLTVTGQPGIQFASGIPAGTTLAAPVPVHRYSFDTQGVDATPLAGGVPLTVTAGASVQNSALVTTGSSLTAGAIIPPSATSAMSGNFTVEQWFIASDTGNNNQVLFSLSTDQNHYLLVRRGRNDNALLSVDLDTGHGPQTTWTTAPAQGVETMLAVTYDATVDEARLYINGAWVGDITLAAGFDLAAVAGPTYSGLNGFAPFPDYHGFNGLTDEFRLYDTALTQPDVVQDFTTGNATLTPATLTAVPTALIAPVPEPADFALLAFAYFASRRRR